ncbi:phasin family protein [Candidatus Paracaedibacter symbiosus]|uniref:phasin family protein n=1 Tax=Candidatus Paracaedibacter symbiosus TaxID=244582 RepID=UPI00050942E7|nr:phasin family protein [Candidatus Paracaedibacter symbiosus]
MEALTEANKMAIEVMKSIAQLQTQYVKQTFEDMSAIMRDVISHPPVSKEAIEKQSHHVKQQADKAFEHGSTISSTLAKSQKEIFDIMHSRYHEGAKEFFNQQDHVKSKTKH